MEDIIKRIKDHPKFSFADSDDEIISIIDDVNPGLSQDQKFEIIDDLEKLGRSGSRKGQDFTADGIKTVANAFKDITTKKIPDAIGKMKEEREGSRHGSRKGRIINTTEHGSYDVSDIDEYVAQGNIVNPKQIMDYLVNEKGYSELKAWATYDVWDEDRFGSTEQRSGSRKGTGPLCELGSVSGKGSRPENLGSIASKIALGRKRYINMDGEYIEQ